MVHIYLKRGVNDDRVIHLIGALNRQQIVILVKETNFYSLCHQKLEALLRRYGKVISTRILRDTDHESRGVGFAR